MSNIYNFFNNKLADKNISKQLLILRQLPIICDFKSVCVIDKHISSHRRNCSTNSLDKYTCNMQAESRAVKDIG